MVKEIPDGLSIGADLRMPAGALSVIQQWKTIINRALALNSRIIFMDEPTSSLTHEEVNELFRSIAHLKATGKAIVYVSHRMEEVFRIADRVTVIRDARKVGTADVGEMDPGKTLPDDVGPGASGHLPASGPASRPGPSGSEESESRTGGKERQFPASLRGDFRSWPGWSVRAGPNWPV